MVDLTIVFRKKLFIPPSAQRDQIGTRYKGPLCKRMALMVQMRWRNCWKMGDTGETKSLEKYAMNHRILINL